MVHRHIRKDFAHVVAPNLYYRVLEMEKVIEGHEEAMRKVICDIAPLIKSIIRMRTIYIEELESIASLLRARLDKCGEGGRR